jgi:hypothetical protein
MASRQIDILQRKAVTRHRANAYEAVSEAVDRKAKESKEVAYLIALEEASEVKEGYASCFECGGDLV